MSSPSPASLDVSPARTPADAPMRAALEALDVALLDTRRHGRQPGYRARIFAAIGHPVDLGTIRVLRAVEHGDELGTVCVGDVAARLDIDPSTASRLVDQQVTAGYLTRTRSHEDRRRSSLSLTPDGRALLAELTDARLEVLAEVIADWSHDEVVELARALDRLRDGFSRLDQLPRDPASGRPGSHEEGAA